MLNAREKSAPTDNAKPPPLHVQDAWHVATTHARSSDYTKATLPSHKASPNDNSPQDAVRTIGDVFWGFGEYEYAGDAIDTLQGALNAIPSKTLGKVAKAAIDREEDTPLRKAEDKLFEDGATEDDVYTVRLEALKKAERDELRAIPKSKKAKRAQVRERYAKKRDRLQAKHNAGKWNFSVGEQDNAITSEDDARMGTMRYSIEVGDKKETLRSQRQPSDKTDPSFLGANVGKST